MNNQPPTITTTDTPASKIGSKVPIDSFELELASKAAKASGADTRENETKDGASGEKSEGSHYELFRYPKEKSVWKQAMWITIWPIHVLFALTIPNCEQNRFKKLFPLTFLMCIIWIGSLSYLVAWMITIVGMAKIVPHLHCIQINCLWLCRFFFSLRRRYIENSGLSYGNHIFSCRNQCT